MQTQANPLLRPRAVAKLATRHAVPKAPMACRLPMRARKQHPAQPSLLLPPPSTQLYTERLPGTTSFAAASCSSDRCRRSTVCSANVAHPGEEREGSRLSGSMSSSIHIPTTGMAKGLGSMGGGATLQKSKLDISQETKSWTPNVDNSGGGGIGGKGIFNGGGGGDEGGDDDDYMDDFGDDGDGGGDDGFFRVVLQENYSRAAINAVLSEWYRTVSSLPIALRQAVEMGLYSSAQLVRFCSMDNRPNLARAVSRALPSPAARGLVGRMMADPAFLQKLGMETIITLSSSLFWEAQQRGERFWSELDFVAINTLCLTAATTALVWSVSPNRSFGAPHKMPWQNMLQQLPNNVFDVSGPQRAYTAGTRATGLAAKTVQLAMAGGAAGAAMSGLTSAAVYARRKLGGDETFTPSVHNPGVVQSSLGLAGSMALFSNGRYQIISGVDRYLFGHSNYLWSYLAFSGIVRVASNRIGEPTRLALQGLPSDPPRRSPAVSARPQRPQYGTITVEASTAPVSPRKRASGSKTGGKKLRKKIAGSKAGKGFEMSAAVPGAA